MKFQVLSAITSTQQRLKLYNKVPTNGLVLYCGTVLTDEGKEKQACAPTATSSTSPTADVLAVALALVCRRLRRGDGAGHDRL